MKVAIVGGGPAGMLAAIAASKEKMNDDEIILIEKNEKLGKKLFITGKGRCNVTNACEKDEFFKNIVRNSKFMFSAFSEFSNKDFMKLLTENGCELKVERGNRVFPVSDKSYDITDCLKRILDKQKVKILLYHELIDINVSKNVFECGSTLESDNTQNVNDNILNKVVSIVVKDLKASKNQTISVDKLIIATGGLSYSSTGSTGDGYRFAKKNDIAVKKQSPSLVPLNIKEINECKATQGLSLKNVGIKIYCRDTKKPIYEDFGEMEFVYFGVSGPIILSASCFLDFDNENNYILSIDLKPALDYEKLDARLLREFSDKENRVLRDVIIKLLPSAMVDAFIDRLTCDENINVAEIDKELRKNIVNLLKDYRFTIVSKRSFEEAIITNGGIDVKELNPKTMESKKVKGLYFAGEVIDVDCLTGGFNIQVAASTGYVAGLDK